MSSSILMACLIASRAAQQPAGPLSYWFLADVPGRRGARLSDPAPYRAEKVRDEGEGPLLVGRSLPAGITKMIARRFQALRHCSPGLLDQPVRAAGLVAGTQGICQILQADHQIRKISQRNQRQCRDR